MPIRFRNDAKAKQAIRLALRIRALQLPPETMRQLLREHVRTCDQSSCQICQTLHQRAACRRVAKRQAAVRRWRGVAKSIGPMLALYQRAAERVFAPGGVGYEDARRSFNVHLAVCY